jgi:hypothetical protein
VKRGHPKRARSSRTRGAPAAASPGATRQGAARTESSTGLTFEDLRALAREFEGIEESTSYGTPALKLRGELLVRLREDGETIVLRTTFVDRDLLIQADPDVYHVTDHYRNYPYVLVRLGHVQRSEFRDRLEEAWERARAQKRERK